MNDRRQVLFSVRRDDKTVTVFQDGEAFVYEVWLPTGPDEAGVAMYDPARPGAQLRALVEVCDRVNAIMGVLR